MRFLLVLLCYLCFTGKPSDFWQERSKKKIPKAREIYVISFLSLQPLKMSAKSINARKNPTRM